MSNLVETIVRQPTFWEPSDMAAVSPQPSSPRWRQPASTTARPPFEERGSGLPSLDLSESKKIKSDPFGHENKPQSTSTSFGSNTPTALASPQGPPPPYSYPSATAGISAHTTGYTSPPDLRRTSDDDKEPNSRSLPSIHEALGKDHGSLYPAAPPLGSHSIHVPVSSSLSPGTPVPRSHPEPNLPGPPGPPNPYATSQPLPPYTSEPTDRKTQPPHKQGIQNEEAVYANRRPSGPDGGPHLTHANSTSSPIPPVRASPHLNHINQQSSPMYPPPTQAAAPPPGYPPGAAYSFPPPSTNSFTNYPAPYPASSHQRPDASSTERFHQDAQRSAPNQNHGAAGGERDYGESVKRHLDIFDLERTLREISEGCNQVVQITRGWADHAYQFRSPTGPTTEAMPTLVQCDEIIARQQSAINLSMRLKENVQAHQQALQEQRTREEASKHSRGEYRTDQNVYAKDPDGSTVFNSGDSKRRRGRNAAPGKCHSCSRSETPEWRRGPDGARTLCNACGLHYAKLTRKMGSKANLASSNLRPKENSSP